MLALLLTASPGRAFQVPEGERRAPPRLGTYLALQRRVTPRAAVIGKFDDWRTVSRYRAHAGLHLGYDVAMPPGSSVVAGWAGQIVRIVPWYREEHGITVRDADGFETTYGHLRPRLAVGATVAPGDVVGTTVIDHVDIKMRAPDGVYYDFGKDAPRVAAAPDRAEALRRYLRARYSVDITREEAQRVMRAEQATRQAMHRHRAVLERVGVRVSDRDLDGAVTRTRRLLERWGQRPDDAADLDDLLHRARRQLDAARRELRRLGIPEP